MQSRSSDDLKKLAACGGSIVLYADTRPVAELVKIARNLDHGASLTLNGMTLRPIEELCEVASAAPGRVVFVV